MNFLSGNGKIGSARLAEKVSTFWPKTWIWRRETVKLGPREWRKKCLIFDQKHGFLVVKWKKLIRTSGGKSVEFLTKNMNFKAWNGKTGSAQVAKFWPKTWIWRRETVKSGPREWRKKCLIFDQKHGFLVVKWKKLIRTSGGKSVEFLTKNMNFKAWNGKTGSAQVAKFWPKTWIWRRETVKSGPREWRKKCLIFDQKHGFLVVKWKKMVRKSCGKSV